MNDQAVIERYRAHLADLDLAEGSVKLYSREAERFAAWASDQGIGLAAIVTPTITQYRRHLQALGRSPTTINVSLIAIKKLCAWMHESGMTRDDPARRVRLVTMVQRRPEAMSDQDEARIMSAIKAAGNKRDYALFSLMLHTGIRESEVVAARWRDADVGKKVGHLVIRGGKGNKYRTVPLNATARQALRMMQPISGSGGQNGFIFPGANGKMMTTVNIRALVGKYRRLSGVDFSAHDLRRRFITRMRAEGVELEDIAEMVGHSDINTTARYSGRTDADQQRAVDRLAWE